MAEPTPIRQVYTAEQRRRFEEQTKAREVAAAKRRQLHDALVRFVRMKPWKGC